MTCLQILKGNFRDGGKETINTNDTHFPKMSVLVPKKVCCERAYWSVILINHNIYQISKFCDKETVLPESRKFNCIYIGYKLYATLFLKTVIDILDMCVIILKKPTLLCSEKDFLS